MLGYIIVLSRLPVTPVHLFYCSYDNGTRVFCTTDAAIGTDEETNTPDEYGDDVGACSAPLAVGDAGAGGDYHDRDDGDDEGTAVDYDDDLNDGGCFGVGDNGFDHAIVSGFDCDDGCGGNGEKDDDGDDGDNNDDGDYDVAYNIALQQGVP